MTDRLPLYVLVGGRSERFGTEKAGYSVDGVPWAMHVAARLVTDATEPTFVGKSAPAWLSEARFLADETTAEGPLAGVMAAVGDRLARWGPGCLAIASCDLVRPDVRWLDPLRAAHATDGALEVAAFRTSRLWQPFPMVVHTRWRSRLATELAAGQRSFQRVLRSSCAQGVPWNESIEGGPPQANTPEALRALLRE